MNRNYGFIVFISNTFILRRPRAAIISNIIKIATMIVQTIFKDSKKFKRIRNYVLKCNLYLYFLIKQNILISVEKMLIPADPTGMTRNLYIFWNFFR